MKDNTERKEGEVCCNKDDDEANIDLESLSCSTDKNDDSDMKEGFCSSMEGSDNENNNDINSERKNKVEIDNGHKRITDLTAEDIRQLEFESEAKACEFYNTYARCNGFAVRKDDIERDSKQNIMMRQLVCNREGLRNKKHFTRLDRCREHKPLTRTKCPAKLRVRLNAKTSKWKVVAFKECHNHELTPPEYIHLIPAYRMLSDADKAQVDSLRSFGVRSCHIMGYLAGQKGGYARAGFTKKDLYNYIDSQRRARVKDGDALAALSYLRAKADNNPLFFGEYTLTDDDRLENLFWADGNSIVDYECFGDVLAFDTTYKKNKYNKPLVIFSGSNHHAQTTIFGCALVSDERTNTYIWLLETFLKAMGNKHPKAVVTDGDGAMREAIKQVFSDATHRLCAWHLHRNACENVKNPSFLADFKGMIYSNYTPDEFENNWKKMVDRHGVSNNNWVEKTYENKSMWAAAYLREKFFGHIRTTSQCEGINSLINAYIRKRNNLVEFMHNLEHALREYRNNEMIANFKSLNSLPVITTKLYNIEECAAKNFTREIFIEVKTEIEEVCALNVIERIENEDNVRFKMNKSGNPKKEFQVLYDRCNYKFLCDCRLFESRGIPCSHIFCAMKYDHMDSIPSSLICRRWTKVAKSDYISSIPAEDVDKQRIETLRFGSLASDCQRLCHLVCENADDFIEVRDDILKIINKIEIRRHSQTREKSFDKVVGDPLMVKTKGTPPKKKFGEKRRKCSNCNKTGHDYRKCPKLGSWDDGNTSFEEEHYLSRSESLTKDVDKAMNDEPLPNAERIDAIKLSNINEKTIKTGSEPPTRKEGKRLCSTKKEVKILKTKKKNDELQSHEHVHAVNIDRGANGVGLLMNANHFTAPRQMSDMQPIFPPYLMYPHMPQVPIYPQLHGLPLYHHPIHQAFVGFKNVIGGTKEKWDKKRDMVSKEVPGMGNNRNDATELDKMNHQAGKTTCGKNSRKKRVNEDVVHVEKIKMEAAVVEMNQPDGKTGCSNRMRKRPSKLRDYV